jgi:hypothetical protein
MLSDSNVWAVYQDVIPLIQQPHSTNTQNQNPNSQNIGADYIRWEQDTTIGSLSYKLFHSRTNEYTPQYSLLREDTLTQQVYLLRAGDTTEHVIYDFSLNAGDSIWLDFQYQGFGLLMSGWWYIDSTNVYTIAAGPRKALYLSNPNNPMHNGNQIRYLQWIESVGCNLSPLYLDENTADMISWLDAYMGPGCSFNTHMYSTTCAWMENTMTFSSQCWENVRQQQQFTYPFGDTCIFMLMGPVEDVNPGIGEVNLTPNPAKEICTLNFIGESPSEFSISITNIMGQEVKEVSPLTWYAKGTHQVSIGLHDLPPGIYSVNLIGEAGRNSVKLIVQ